MKKRMFSMLLVFCMLCSLLPTAAFAISQSSVYGEFTVTGDDLSGIHYANRQLSVTSSAPITIANTDPKTATKDIIYVNSQDGANITLAGVNIVSPDRRALALNEIQNAAPVGPVTITLKNGTKNILSSASKFAGLSKEIKAELTITCEDGNKEEHTCTADTCGALTASANGGIAAGIGGDPNWPGSNITIHGGIITANGGWSVGSTSGGGGMSSTANQITISGGKVKAIGGSDGTADFLEPSYTISGTITGSDTNSGIFARLQLKNNKNEAVDSPVTAASNGTYGISGVLPRTYSIETSLTNYDTATQTNIQVSANHLTAQYFTLTRTALTGTVNINGVLKFGEPLTLALSSANNSGILSYQWNRDDIPINSATNQTYITGADDIGKSLTGVVISSV